MEYLRWILLLFGIAVLVVVYLISRNRRNSDVPVDQDDLDDGDYLFDEIDRDWPPTEGIEETEGEPVPGVKKPLASAVGHVSQNVPLSNVSCQLDASVGPSTEENNLPETYVEPVPDSRSGRKKTEPNFPNPLLMDNLFGEKKGVDPTSTGDSQPEKIIVLHVCARPGERIQGVDLVRVFETRGYQFGEMGIYHSHFEGRTIFSLVNMVEPGWFTPTSMEEFSTPGVSLFLRLPGPLPGDVAFDLLLGEARAVALDLDAVVLDASRSTFTWQMEQHIREELKQYYLRYTR